MERTSLPTLVDSNVESAATRVAEAAARKAGPHRLCNPLVPTIFHEEWWLEAATGGKFDIVEVTQNGQTLGRLPYYIRKRYGLKEVCMPPVTYFLGPAIDEGEGSANNRFLKRMDITRTLIQKLPRSASMYIKCHKGVQEVIAFQEQQFRTYAQFTYEISPKPIEVLWQQMRNKTRNVIRRAQEQFTACELDDPSKFVRAYEENLASKGLRNGIDRNVCSRILSSTIERKRGQMIAAYDKNRQMIAVIFCAADTSTSFYTLSTRCENAGNGATSLLIWEAIKRAAERGLTFDFAGLAGQGSILLYTGFGGIISPRYVAVRIHPLVRALAECKSLFVKENCFY